MFQQRPRKASLRKSKKAREVSLFCLSDAAFRSLLPVEMSIADISWRVFWVSVWNLCVNII